MESLMFLGALTVLFTLVAASYLLGCASRSDSSSAASWSRHMTAAAPTGR